MNTTRSVNIKQVAKASGFSVATVSRALQKPELVAPETLNHVRATVERLGYVPNMAARNLRTERTRIILVLVADIASPFSSEVVRGIERVAHANGYSVLLGDTQADLRLETSYAQLITSRQADGIITLLPHVPLIRRSGRLPLINACAYLTDKEVTSVYVDNVAASRVATDYLLTLGHRKVALINGNVKPVSADREQGYREALEVANIPVDPKLIVEADFRADAGVRAIDTLFARGAEFTGLFCASDERALGAMTGLRARGLEIPRDVSIVGFDDIALAKFFCPPLTTIAQPKIELGEEAMRLLLDLLDDPTTPIRKCMLPTQLVVRQSAARYTGA